MAGFPPSAVGPRGQRGAALILVLGVVSVLTVVMLQFQRSTRIRLDDAVRFQDRQVMLSAVQSGVDIGCAVLQADRKVDAIDALSDPWSVLGKMVPITAERSMTPSLEIVDLAGLFPIASLAGSSSLGDSAGSGTDELPAPEYAREVLLRLLLSGRFTVDGETQAREIVDSLTDWVDDDDVVSDYGAERDYYQSLDHPYRPRNGVPLFIRELLLVRGVTPQLLYGTDEKSGLADYITVNGDGRININTAPVAVLHAFDPRLTDTEIEALDTFRRNPGHRGQLGTPNWYRFVPGWPQGIMLDSSLITTTSRFFRISASAQCPTGWLKEVAVVQRGKTGLVRTLQIRIE